MIATTLTFLTPRGAFLALAAVVPLGALLLADRRVGTARRVLGLAAPDRPAPRATVIALAAVPVLLGLAAAQPVLESREGQRVRTDAEAFFVLDTSRSMAAASRAGGKQRLSRAQDAALRLRAALPAVPSGVATLTDRVLPDLFPTADEAAFASTVRGAVELDQPPPQTVEVVATTLAPLADVATQGYFAPSARSRLMVVLTDGETRPYSAARVARALRSGPGVSLVLVHVWGPDERVFRGSGRAEVAYRADERSADELAQLAAATGGSSFSEDDLDGAAQAARSALGAGPTAERGQRPTTTPLAPYVAAAGLLPLLLVLRRRNVR